MVVISMQFFTLPLLASAAAAAIVACPPAAGNRTYCPSKPATNKQQEDIFAEFRNTYFIERDASAALNAHMTEDYIQHNPNILSGRQNAIDALNQFLPLITFTVLRAGVQNNLAWVHIKGELQGTIFSTVDIFRFEGTCMREHWDVTQIANASSPNPLALF